MKISKLISIFFLNLLPLSIFADKPRQSVGLVLSGGGAKGIAHIGVIQALEENNIPIDYIAGTSMGAIVGGLYASGYSPDEMMALLQSPDFANWSTGQIDEKLTYYFAKSDPTPSLFDINLGKQDSVVTSSIIPQGIINPLPMNFAFMQLFSAYTAQCDGNFDNLYVPFICIASDVTHKHKIVCRSGSLGDAIRASMSFPIVFYPIEINGVYMYDGGIYDNFPVDVMKHDFAPSIIIGVNVSTPETKSSTNTVVDQLSAMIMQGTVKPVAPEDGIYIHLNLEHFGLLDFPKAKAIYDIGYARATEMMDTITTRITARIPSDARRLKRKVFKAKTPYLTFDSVGVTGGTKAQNNYIKYVFTKGNSDTFGIEQAKDSYYRIITPGKLNNLIPHANYDKTDSIFTLNLKASVKDNYKLGLGGYISSSTNSMLFLSGGYNTLSFNSFDANINTWIGQSYIAADINAKMYLRSAIPSYLKLQAVASRQKFYENENLFYEDNMPSFISNTELFGRLNYCIAAGRRGKFEIGMGYGYLYDRFYQSDVIDFASHNRDKCSYSLGQARLSYEHNTLNSSIYPTSGALYKATAIGVMGNYDYSTESLITVEKTTKWVQLELCAENYFNISSKLTFGTELNILASTKKLVENYYATIVQSPAYTPTASSYNAFNPAFRANSYAAAGIKPIWKLSKNIQLRGEFHSFLPFREIKENVIDFSPYYGKWFSNPEFFGEIAAVMHLPFASLSAYGNYMSYPRNNWNFGFSFGLFFLAPKFLR